MDVPAHWIETLLRRLQEIYPETNVYQEYSVRFFGLNNIYNKFNDCLKGITGEAIKNALQRVKLYYPKLPTPDQFKSLCRDKTIGIENLGRIREIIKNPIQLTEEEKERFIQEGITRSQLETNRLRANIKPISQSYSPGISPIKSWNS